MAVFGIGCDIEKVERFKYSEAKLSLAKKIFTEKELSYALEYRFPEQRLCARFCAKEAFFKALGTGVRGNMSFLDVEIAKDSLGKPEIILSGGTKEYFEKLGLKKIALSISHNDCEALAFVIIEN
ncbi:holo-ACP synthase [bacterium]|nr:holo-ACP synthase [bacterium]